LDKDKEKEKTDELSEAVKTGGDSMYHGKVKDFEVK
jgi:hypothetical protein